MSLLHQVSNAIGDVVVGPWASLTVALLVSASVLAAVIVGVFRLVGRPQCIRRARNRLLARALELLLFGHDGRTMLTASGRILTANAVYLWQFAIPLVVTAAPVTLLLIQGAAWFAHRPYRVGEPVIVEVVLAPGRSVLKTRVSLKTAECLMVTAGPVRIPGHNELCFRLVAAQAGDGWVELAVEDHTIRKQIMVGDRLARLSTERRQDRDWGTLLHPAEPPLAADSSVVRITTPYPQRTWNWGFREYDAGVVCVVLTLVLSLVFARVFGVSIV